MTHLFSSLSSDGLTSDGRWFWLAGLIAFAACAAIIRTAWPAKRRDHILKDYDGYIDDLLTTNGSRVRRHR